MIKAKALVSTADQRFSLEDVLLKEPAADQVLIRTCCTGVSIGTEFALIRNKISWGPFPICTGYQGTGIVEALGADVTDFAVGDKVYYRGNDFMQLPDGKPITCASGTHCSHIVRQPKSYHGVAKVIPGAGLDVASLFVMPAVGLHGVDIANPRMGQNVVVHGVGLIGLGVVAACAQRGCNVMAVDINETHLDLARKFGADHLFNAATANVPTAVKQIAPDGADAVFECTGLPQCIEPCIPLCRINGSFVWQGNYGAAPMPFRFLQPHGRQLTMFFPCDDGGPHCRRAVVKNMAMGVLPWEHCITHRIGSAESPEMFRRINAGQEQDIMGVVIQWSD